jgi:WD40 repeat protein
MLNRAALSVCVLSFVVASASAQDAKVTYIDHVQPIFRAKCFACHNPDRKSGGLDLTNFTAMQAGGSSGEVVEAGDPESSYLWLVVNHDSEPYMPPNSDKMPDEMLAVIKKWIEGGALETKDSKATIKPKKKMEFALSFASNERPEGPPPMPTRLSLEPVVHTAMTTAVNSIATSPWAPLVAISGQKQIELYNTQTLQLAGIIPFPEGEPHVLRFTRNSQFLLAAGGVGAASGKVVIFDVKTGERIATVGDELDAVLGADISSDLKYVALGGPQKVVRIYSTQTGEKLFDIRKHTDWVTAVQFSPDGVLLATGDRNGGVFVWEAETGREYLGLRGHTGQITGFSWRGDSNVLASASEDASVRTWELENGNQLKSWGAHGGGTASVWFTRDNQIVTSGRDKTVKLWKEDGTAVRTFEAFGDLALAAAYCDETGRVIGGDWTGLVRVWNAADGARLGDLSTNPAPLQMRLAQAQQVFAQSDADQKAKQAAYDAAVAAMKKVETDLATAKTQATQFEAKAKELTATIDTAKKTSVDAKAKYDAAAKIVAALQALVPALQEAVGKGDAAVAKAAGDNEVAAVVEQLKKIFAARQAVLAASTKTAADEMARMKTADQMVADQAKLLAETNTGLEAARKRIGELEPALAVEQKKVADAKAALDQATAATAAAQQAVARWTREIDFNNRLKMFVTKRTEVESLEVAFAESDAELKAMQARVTTAQEALAAAQKAEQVATAEATAAKTELQQVTATREAELKNLASRESAVAVLKEAVDKGTAAAAVVKDDKELATAAEQLKAAFERNNQAIAVTKTKIGELDKLVAAAELKARSADEKVTQAKAVVAAADTKMKAEVAAMAPVQQKSTQAKAAFETARAALDQIRGELDSVRQQAGAAASQSNQG